MAHCNEIQVYVLHLSYEQRQKIVYLTFAMQENAIMERLLVTMPKYKPVIHARSFFSSSSTKEIKNKNHSNTHTHTHIHTNQHNDKLNEVLFSINILNTSFKFFRNI